MGASKSVEAPCASPDAPQKRKEQAPQKKKLTCKWDGAEVKHTLDDLATQAVLERGHVEDLFVSNVKIVLGVVTCGLALLAHFHPAKFPANYWLTLGCVVGYVACNAALQLFAAYFERDVFLFTRPPPPGGAQGGGTGGAADGASPRPTGGLEVSSGMPQYSDMYTLRIQQRPAPAAAAGARGSGGSGGGSSGGGAAPVVELERSVAAWIHDDGTVAEELFAADVHALLDQLAAGEARKQQ